MHEIIAIENSQIEFLLHEIAQGFFEASSNIGTLYFTVYMDIYTYIFYDSIKLFV